MPYFHNFVSWWIISIRIMTHTWYFLPSFYLSSHISFFNQISFLPILFDLIRPSCTVFVCPSNPLLLPTAEGPPLSRLFTSLHWFAWTDSTSLWGTTWLQGHCALPHRLGPNLHAWHGGQWKVPFWHICSVFSLLLYLFEYHFTPHEGASVIGWEPLL